ncbi:DUF202 domain-containing protein [Pseudarthrobacter sp. NBSH8]|uniref:DUF202 domain-containing protein n=1 Tax=Pseudarthrobacter sp. NBSH8 TaxID=2596911 RepID=UPI00351AD213
MATIELLHVYGLAQNSPPRHGDAGLQPERTDLAWSRTTLSMWLLQPSSSAGCPTMAGSSAPWWPQP